MASTLSLSLFLLSDDQDDKQSCNRVQMMNETIRVPRDVSIRRVKKTEEEKNPKFAAGLMMKCQQANQKCNSVRKWSEGSEYTYRNSFFKEINIEE